MLPINMFVENVNVNVVLHSCTEAVAVGRRSGLMVEIQSIEISHQSRCSFVLNVH